MLSTWWHGTYVYDVEEYLVRRAARTHTRHSPEKGSEIATASRRSRLEYSAKKMGQCPQLTATQPNTFFLDGKKRIHVIHHSYIFVVIIIMMGQERNNKHHKLYVRSRVPAQEAHQLHWNGVG